MKKGIIFLVMMNLVVSIVNAFSIHLTPLDAGGNLQADTEFDYEFNFTTDVGCNNVVLGYATNVTTRSDGSTFVVVDISNITEQVNYVCEYRDNSLRKVHNFSDQIFRNVMEKNQTSFGDINATGNITAPRGTFDYFSIIGYLYGLIGVLDVRGDPWYLSGTDLRIAQDLDVDTDLNVDGDADIGDELTSTYYCIGTDCISAWSDINQSFEGTYVLKTGDNMSDTLGILDGGLFVNKSGVNISVDGISRTAFQVGNYSNIRYTINGDGGMEWYGNGFASDIPATNLNRYGASLLATGGDFGVGLDTLIGDANSGRGLYIYRNASEEDVYGKLFVDDDANFYVVVNDDQTDGIRFGTQSNYLGIVPEKDNTEITRIITQGFAKGLDFFTGTVRIHSDLNVTGNLTVHTTNSSIADLGIIENGTTISLTSFSDKDICIGAC